MFEFSHARVFVITVISVFMAACAHSTGSALIQCQQPMSCKHQKVPTENTALHQVAADYFSVYATRKDFERLMTFYADSAQLDDIVYGNRLKDKAEIRAFLDWSKGNFKVQDGDRALSVASQTILHNKVVTEGYFHKFSYNGETLGPWLFVIIQEFNADNKIIRQRDWINYTPKANFLNGKNMNHSILTR